MTDLKTTVKTCFRDMYVAARFNAKKNYKVYKKQNLQYHIARSLVFLEDVSKNPDKYFSVEFTNAAWNKRVEDYIKNNKMINQDIKIYGMEYMRKVVKGSLVFGPGDIVCNNIKAAWPVRGLHDFCQEVELLYYKDLRSPNYVNETFIKEYAYNIHALAEIAKQKNPLKRGLMKMFCNYQR